MQLDTLVELEDINGEWWDLTNGDRGVYLATGVKGLMDPPIKVVYEEPGNYPGARFLSDRVLRRDLVFGVEILNDAKAGTNSWISRDSEWRKAWSTRKDCKLHVTTTHSGHRYLKCRLGDQGIEIDTEVDPQMNTINRAAMVTFSGDPFWYEDDVVYSAVTETDTRFDPAPLPWPWPQSVIPTETLYIEVDPADGRGGLNPTDQYIWLKWTTPGSGEMPSEPYIPGIPWLGAPESPATIFTLPDYSFEDEELQFRRLRLPGQIGGLVTNEVQRVRITGLPSSGTFVLKFKGEPTTSLAYNASTATVKTALEALDTIGVGNVDVAGGPILGLPFQPYLVTFKGELSGLPQPPMDAVGSFGGGTTPWIYVDTTIQGGVNKAENVVWDTDPRVEQATSESGSPIWQRMNGVRFRHPIPPYTKSKVFEITASGCAPGQMVTLRIPRPWSRPWGLE